MMGDESVLAAVFFANFLQWAASQPNAEELLTQLTLVNNALVGVDEDREGARAAALALSEVAHYGPNPEVMVRTFNLMAEALALA